MWVVEGCMGALSPKYPNFLTLGHLAAFSSQGGVGVDNGTMARIVNLPALADSEPDSSSTCTPGELAHWRSASSGWITQTHACRGHPGKFRSSSPEGLASRLIVCPWCIVASLEPVILYSPPQNK